MKLFSFIDTIPSYRLETKYEWKTKKERDKCIHLSVITIYIDILKQKLYASIDVHLLSY